MDPAVDEKRKRKKKKEENGKKESLFEKKVEDSPASVA